MPELLSDAQAAESFSKAAAPFLDSHPVVRLSVNRLETHVFLVLACSALKCLQPLFVDWFSNFGDTTAIQMRIDEEFNFFKNPVIGVVSTTNNDEARLSAAVEYTNSISDIHPLDLHYPVLRAPVDIELGLLPPWCQEAVHKITDQSCGDLKGKGKERELPRNHICHKEISTQEAGPSKHSCPKNKDTSQSKVTGRSGSIHDLPYITPRTDYAIHLLPHNIPSVDLIVPISVPSDSLYKNTPELHFSETSCDLISPLHASCAAAATSPPTPLFPFLQIASPCLIKITPRLTAALYVVSVTDVRLTSRDRADRRIGTHILNNQEEDGGPNRRRLLPVVLSRLTVQVQSVNEVIMLASFGCGDAE
ncbi:hypothetical protein M422DRAFT_256202 [Sphaerobolus stellatus SS14]|uniref:Uncharacterized protein n=1 Tax=Sphaerobolus stellatus (strain SS14) TaxID=990650 RepID=A0A0C9VS01_SPHS4|nr:hypothetical protein M422DRAFT_256202 [Sphaerobolus stellatus SS14]